MTLPIVKTADERKPLVKMPDPATLPDFYIVRCDGPCLVPVVPDGAWVIVDKQAQVAPGDLVILFFKPEHVPAGRHQAILKRLVLNVPPYVKFPWQEHPQSDVHALIIVEMINPKHQFAYKAEHLLAVHKCLGPVPDDAVYDPKTDSWRIPSLASPALGKPPRARRPRKAAGAVVSS